MQRIICQQKIGRHTSVPTPSAAMSALGAPLRGVMARLYPGCTHHEEWGLRKYRDDWWLGFWWLDVELKHPDRPPHCRSWAPPCPTEASTGQPDWPPHRWYQASAQAFVLGGKKRGGVGWVRGRRDVAGGGWSSGAALREGGERWGGRRRRREAGEGRRCGAAVKEGGKSERMLGNSGG